MEQISADAVNGLINTNIAKYQDQIKRLDAVKVLVPEEIIEKKKGEIINIIFALQDVQQGVLDMVVDAQNIRMSTNFRDAVTQKRTD